MLKRGLLFILILVKLCAINAQGYKGNSFWLGLLPNQFAPDEVKVMIIADEAGSLSVSAPAQSFNNSFNYLKGNTIINLTKSIVVPTALPGSKDNKGIKLTSTSEVKLIVLNELSFSSDAALIYPENKILSGDEYIVQSLKGSLPGASSFTVVSPKNNIEVSIQLTANTLSGSIAGSTLNIVLDEGESFTVRADGDEDLSGTRVKARNGCDRFFVFAGSRCSQSDYNSSTCTGCDHLFSQLIPTSQYGKTFYVAPFANQSNNYTVKITAANNNTNVSIDNVNITTLNAGNSFEYRPFAPNFKKSCISADKPIQVYQYMNSSGCNGNPTGKGDPSMLFIPPVSKWTKSSSFSFFNSGNVNEHYANIIAHKNAEIKVSGSGTFNSFIKDTTTICNDIAVYYLDANVGDFEISSDSFFYSYNYSLGTNESYAYLTGADIFSYQKPLSNFTSVELCYSEQPLNLSVDNDSLIVVSWNMGDGNNYGAQSNISHRYLMDGSYNASVVLRKTNSTCAGDTLDIDVTILSEVNLSPIKDSVVCPGEKVSINLPVDNNLIYTWSDASKGNTKEFDNPGQYFVSAQDSNGCEKIDSFEITDEGCFDKSIEAYNIFTPNDDGINDLWIVNYKGYESLNVDIYNRYGVRVFKGNLLNQEFWDGKILDSEASSAEGVYYYQINGVTLRTNKKESYSGVIMLIR